MADYNPELESLVRELNKKATGQGAGPAPQPVAPLPPGATKSLDRILKHSVERGASDVLFIAGSGIVQRLGGRLQRSPEPVLTDEAVRNLLLPLLSPERREELEAHRSFDFSFVRDGIGRFRANLHYQRGTLAAALRILPAEIPTLASLNLPLHLSKLVDRKQGLILVTGPTGSGKTSTQAALMGIVNRKYPYHVVSIEDPIEYYHKDDQAVFEQIEIGHDCKDFASALRSILRQNPDVILVGEMRDPETVATVLSAAETGHLVLSTLHTNDAVQAVNRIVDQFPAGRQEQIRQQLSLGLLAIIAQQLVPSVDGESRFPALEILLANTAVRHLIRKGEDHMLSSQLSLGRGEGMIMMEQSLAELVRKGRIAKDVAAAHCLREGELQRHLV